MAWGDLDGDGDLDLACGNQGQSTLYRNEFGGILLPVASWVPPVNDTRSLAWGDVDGDGDLDLVCGNFAQKNTLFRNDSGVLSSTPSWSR